MKRFFLDLKPAPPFRLHLTVWALRRRPDNIVDRRDGRTYCRVLVSDNNGPRPCGSRRYIEELESLKKRPGSGALTGEQTRSLQRVLHDVHGLVKIHFAREEEVYLPILDQHLTPESAQEMFEAMEEAAHKAKSNAY